MLWSAWMFKVDSNSGVDVDDRMIHGGALNGGTINGESRFIIYCMHASTLATMGFILIKVNKKVL